MDARIRSASGPSATVSPAAGWATIAGGALTVALGFPLARLQAGPEIPDWILLTNAVSHLLLAAGVVGLAKSRVPGAGWLGRFGIGLTLLALADLTLAELVAIADPTRAEWFYATATLLVAFGLVVAGAAVVRAGRWQGWRRYVLLACGLYVPLVLVPSFALPGLAPHYAIGVWGVVWTVVGVALLRPQPPAASATAWGTANAQP